jgi:hypothetical protein
MWICIYGRGKGRSISKAHNAFCCFQLNKIIVSSISKIISGIPIYFFLPNSFKRTRGRVLLNGMHKCQLCLLDQ